MLCVLCFYVQSSFRLDAEQDCGVDEKNVGEVESFFKVLLFEICPQFPVCKRLLEASIFLMCFGSLPDDYEGPRIQLLAAPAFCYIECLCGYCDAPGEI
jgi:hypothetical protein